MRRAASVIGIIGGALGLITATTTGLIGLALTLMPGLGLPSVSGLLQVVVPIAALFAAARAMREPRLAGTLLTGCGVAASLLLNYFQALFYLVAGVLALLGERETAQDSPQAAAAVPARPLPAWLPGAGCIAAISAVAAGLASGVNALGHGSESGSFALAFVLVGLVAAVSSGLGLAGAVMCARRPWEGGLLMTAGGLLTAIASLFIASVMPLFGLWGLASGVALAVAGTKAWASARRQTRGPAPARRPLPRVSATLVAVAILAGLYAGGRALGFDLALKAAFPEVLGPRLEVSVVTPLAAEGCLAVGPVTLIRDHGWLDNRTVWVSGDRDWSEASVVIAGLGGEARQFTLTDDRSTIRGDFFPLKDHAGFVFSSISLSTLGARDEARLSLCVESRPSVHLLTGRFEAVPSPSGRFLLCAGEGWSVVYDLSSAVSVEEGPIIRRTRHDATLRPHWRGENLVVYGAPGDAKGTYHIFSPGAEKEPAGVCLPGEPSISGDGQRLAVLVPGDLALGGPNAYQGKEILVYDLASLTASGSAEPRARLAPRGDGMNWPVWSDDGANLAYLDGAWPYYYARPASPPAALMLASGPSFEPRPLPMPAGEIWKPISFSTDGRYLLVAATRTDGSDQTSGVVLDTETGAASALPSGLGTLDLADARWLGPSTLWICPQSGDSGPGTWFYYEAATAQTAPCPWWAYAYCWEVKLSPDRQRACVQVSVNSRSPIIPARCTGFGPFEQLPEGDWLFVFPVGPRFGLFVWLTSAATKRR